MAGRAKYNIGVINTASVAAAQRYEDVLTLTQAAVRYFRESLESTRPRGRRYNLELAYRLQRQIEAELLRAQQNVSRGIERTSPPGAVQALLRPDRNEGGGRGRRCRTRRAAPWPARQRDAAELRRQSGQQRAAEDPRACRWRWARTTRIS